MSHKISNLYRKPREITPKLLSFHTKLPKNVYQLLDVSGKIVPFLTVVCNNKKTVCKENSSKVINNPDQYFLLICLLKLF